MLGRVLLLLVIQLLAKQGLIHARPSHDPGQTGLCPSIGLPAGGVREVNLIHDGKPKYRLDLQQSRRGYVPGRTYSIYIRAQDPTQTFGDSLLSVTSESRTCKHGNFSIQSQSYYQPEGCDHMVLKNTREFEHTFSFQWTAPTCGCVILRARVRSVNNVYYLDNKNVIDGYLTKRVCRRQMSTILSKISHIEREDLLCHVVSKSDDHMVDEDHFLRRRKMNPTLMSVLERDALMVSLSQRVYEVNKCCVQTGVARADCLGDIRRHRIDQLCANTEHLPFTVQGDAYMTERRDNCCWRLGERRYDCFAMGRQGGGVPPPQSDVDTEVATVTNVLDESDPVNDIEDYPNRLSEELVKLNLNHEEPESDDNSIAADIPSKDFVSNSAPRPSHKNMLALPKHTAKQQISQSTTTEKTTPLQPTVTEESTKMAPTPQTQLLKQTTQGLEKKLLRAQMELDCCQQGKQYGTTLIMGNTWDRCEQRTRKVTKIMKGKKKRWCRRYHLRCCVEGAQRSLLGSQNGDIGEIGEERRVSGQQRSHDQVSEQRRLRDQVNEQPRSHDQTDVQQKPQGQVSEQRRLRDQVSERPRLRDQVNEQPRSYDQTDVQQRPQGQVSEQQRLNDQVNEQPSSHDQTGVQQKSQGQVKERRRLRDNVNEQQRPEVQFDDDTIELEQQRLKDTVERKNNDVIYSEMTTAMRVENRDRDEDDNDDDDNNDDDDDYDDDDDDDQTSKNQYQEENFSDGENYEDTEEENEDEYDDQDGGEAEEDEEGDNDFTSHEETISSIESSAVTRSSDQALESIEETRSTEETLRSIDQPEGSITSEQTSEQLSEQSSGQQSRSEELSREDRMRRRKQRQSRRKGRKNRGRKGRKHVSI
ncbi:uncharacterized protein [Argopecten irradians]|uniref:uncharacterized protein isoform X2 n=1 Tax=Argopecten irradians TaxID=31199 RepID=UPI00371DD366